MTANIFDNRRLTGIGRLLQWAVGKSVKWVLGLSVSLHIQGSHSIIVLVQQAFFSESNKKILNHFPNPCALPWEEIILVILPVFCVKWEL